MSATLNPVQLTFAPAQGLTAFSGAGTEISVIQVNATDILLSYNTLPGNQPSSNANTVFIWQNSASIPYSIAPLASQAVPGNSQSGSMVFGNLTIQTKGYIIGYAVGPNVSNICSWAFVPAQGDGIQTFQTSISVVPSPDAVLVNFTTPDGNRPQANQHYVAIWQGSVVPYGVAPLAKANIGSDAAEGSQALPCTLMRKTTYTVGYFAGPKQSMLAATFTFTT